MRRTNEPPSTVDNGPVSKLSHLDVLVRGSLLYLNGEKIVDNNGCHGAKEKRSHRKSLSFGTHHLVVDMCEVTYCCLRESGRVKPYSSPYTIPL